MPKLAKIVVEDDEYEYELSLNWDDGAYAEKQIKFNVEGRRRHKAEEAWQDPVTVSASIEEGEDGAVLKIGSEEFNAEFPLQEIFGESQIIDQLPAHIFGTDPITGCLVRSGLSASIGQIIECKNATIDLEWFYSRIKGIFGCINANVPEMVGKFSMRAVKCITLGGM